MPQIPTEVAYRGVNKTAAVDALIEEQVAKLERVCDHLDSCRVAVERPNGNVSAGSGFRVRVDLTVPPQHEIAATREPGDGEAGDDVAGVIRAAFDAAKAQLQKLVQKQRGDVKAHSR